MIGLPLLGDLLIYLLKNWNHNNANQLPGSIDDVFCDKALIPVVENERSVLRL